MGVSGAFKVSIAPWGNFTTEDTESTEVEKKKTAEWESSEAQDELKLWRLKRNLRPTLKKRGWGTRRKCRTYGARFVGG